MEQVKPLSFPAFQETLAELLQVDVAQVTPEAYFVTDLGVDSMRMMELLLQLEETGVEFSLETAWQIQTVDDAYRYYRDA